jgi:anaphase-promoting complex subunit 2
MSEALELEDALMRTFDPKKPTPSSIANVSAEEAFLWIKDLLEITNMTLAQFRSDDLDDYIAHRMCLTLQQRYGSVLASAVKKFLMKCFDLWLDNEFDEVEKVLDLYCKLQLNFAYQNVVQELLETQITDHLQEAISGEYERIYMPELQEWFDGVIVPFLSAFRLVPSSSVRDNTLLENLRGYLEASYVRLRSNELFDMIASFPDSMIAIRELRDVANASNSSNVIGKVFGSELQRRLLHLGASTKQILDMYISVIRALRVLDPSDTLLNHVTKPVRRYLRDRKDTVRTIVSSLTQSRGDGEDGGASELHGELRRGGGSLSLGVGASDDEDEALNSCEEWRPAKRHPDITFAPGRGQDILALLVSIYGSTDLFVQEYRNLLSEKLIQLMDYDADIEISTLELLKIRYSARL